MDSHSLHIPTIDWKRIFPDTDHRWAMGLRPGSLSEFFAPRDPTGAVLAERCRWLTEAPSLYAALHSNATSALQETVQVARSQGVSVPEAATASDQLLALGNSWESDFVWMIPQDSGEWSLAGGVVCFPSSWSMPDKLGQPLREIHAIVPGLNLALEKQIDTFLNRMQPGQSWLRENAGFSRDRERNHLPSRPRRSLDETVTTDEIFIRVEHQLLSKLPVSGAILFGIRVEVVPLTAALAEAGVAARLRRTLSTLSPRAAQYKGIEKSREAILARLG